MRAFLFGMYGRSDRTSSFYIRCRQFYRRDGARPASNVCARYNISENKAFAALSLALAFGTLTVLRGMADGPVWLGIQSVADAF
jgi:hypothetical protein